LPLQQREGGGEPQIYAWRSSWVPKVRVWSSGSEAMVAMATLRGRRRFPHLPVHPIGGDHASDIDKDKKSSSHCSNGVVDLPYCLCMLQVLCQDIRIDADLLATRLAVHTPTAVR
jgi:hypothetical protein